MRRFNGHGKGGLILAGVHFHHHRQLQLTATRFGDTQAHNTAAMTNRERHLLWRNGFGGKNQIAFVLAIFIIQHQYTAASTQCC